MWSMLLVILWPENSGAVTIYNLPLLRADAGLDEFQIPSSENTVTSLCRKGHWCPSVESLKSILRKGIGPVIEVEACSPLPSITLDCIFLPVSSPFPVSWINITNICK